MAVQDAGLSELLRKRLTAQADLFAALTSHPTLIGSGREDALAELFRQFMPRRFEILSGTVAIVGMDGSPSRSTHQLDMIVADTMDFPTLVRSGNLAVVLAPSVRAVMEVKSDLKRGASFVAALVQAARARQLLKATDPVFTGLFSFGAPSKPETLREWLEDVVVLRRFLATQRGSDEVRQLRDQLLGSPNPSAASQRELLEVLGDGNLPDIVAADRGAVARKATDEDGHPYYTFLEQADGSPSVMVVIDQFVEQLGATASAVFPVDGAGEPPIRKALGVVRAHLGIKSEPAKDLADLSLLDAPPTPTVAS